MVTSEKMRQEDVKRYLFAEMADDEREAFDERMFADDDLFFEVSDVENRVVDQYVAGRSEEHTSELQSPCNLVCRLLLEKKKYHLPASRRASPHRGRRASRHAALRSAPPRRRRQRAHCRFSRGWRRPRSCWYSPCLASC